MFLTRERDLCLDRGSAGEHTVLAVCLLTVLLLGVYPGPLFDLIAVILP